MSRPGAARRLSARLSACPWTPRSRRDPHPSEAGFTLVEVMAAMFIFAVLSTAVFTLIVTALKTVHQDNERVLTANAARTQVEYLRSKGTANITPGLSTEKAPGIPAGYTVQTSAQWVGLGQTASACDAAQPGQAYLRLRVEVKNPQVGGSDVLDTVIAPSTAVVSAGTAGVALSVDDQNGDPVSGVTVAAIDTIHPANSFTYVTGADGCLFIPLLVAPSTLNVTINKSGYVSSTATGTQATVPLTANSLAKPSFLYAPAAAIGFSGTLADFPLPAAMPVSWKVNDTGATLKTTTAGASITGLWPTPTGFTAWSGDCADADPVAYGGVRQQFTFKPGGTVAAQLDVRPVKLRGLPADVPVTVTHVGGGIGCTSSAIAIGRTDAKGIIKVGLPSGAWQATGGGQTQQVGTLQPPAAGVTETTTLVNFTLANLDGASPSASPSPTPTVTP